MAFVRLNGFLLRTHATSLVSALGEDGWLEGWERERLLRRIRAEDSCSDSRQWSQTFLQIYKTFVETEDVAGFVAGIQARLL